MTARRARIASAFSVLAALAATSSASAAPTQPAGPDRAECVAAADEGQKLRDDGKLNAARDKFITCASKTCPGVVAKSCAQWLSDAEREIPTVTFRALDEAGKEITDVKVSVDGAVVSASIGGKAISVDPGEHALAFERADGSRVEDKVLIRPGEKNKLLELAFKPKAPEVAPAPAPVTPPSAPAPERKFHVPMLGWVGLGVFGVGAITTVAFAAMANGDESDLRSTCAPNCPSSEKSAIDTKLVIANIGMGVGLAGLGLAVVTTVLENTKPARAEQTQTQKAPARSVALDVSPAGAVTLRGAF